MKKYKIKNKIRGLKTSDKPLTVVRWLGAYGSASDIQTMCEFEKSPERTVSAEVLSETLWSEIEHAKVGLLVDYNSTELYRAYAWDAWTGSSSNSHGDSSVAKRNVPFVTKWNEVISLRKISKRLQARYNSLHCGSYVEVSINSPIYRAVVVKSNLESAWKVAEKIGNLMGLPVIHINKLQNGGCMI